MTKDETQDEKSGVGDRDPIAIWDDLLDLMAEDDAETGDPTDADREWSAAVDAKVKSRLAEMRRQLTPGDVPILRGVEVPPELEAYDRQEIVARLEILRQLGFVRYAQQELTGFTDSHLRIMLALAMRRSSRR